VGAELSPARTKKYYWFVLIAWTWLSVFRALVKVDPVLVLSFIQTVLRSAFPPNSQAINSIVLSPGKMFSQWLVASLLCTINICWESVSNSCPGMNAVFRNSVSTFALLPLFNANTSNPDGWQKFRMSLLFHRPSVLFLQWGYFSSELYLARNDQVTLKCLTG